MGTVITNRDKIAFCSFRRIWLVIIIVLCSLLLMRAQKPTQAKNTAEAKEAIEQLESKWLHALSKADVSAIGDILADDFVRPAPEYDQFVGKSDLLSFYRSHLKPQSQNKKRLEDMTVTVYGESAIARGTLTTRDRDGRVVAKLLFTDVFVLRCGRWQAVSAQENAVSATAPKH
jgi:ketosteroid isomerase-like protein